METGERTPINLQKLLTPATDSHKMVQTKTKKMYASSYFYAPTHPTVEDQVELARRISHSLSDAKNLKSKGQSMYVNRKKRSVKWVHEGDGIEGEEEPPSPKHKGKIPLKCMMNPNGKVLDINQIQEVLGEEVNIEAIPSHPEKLFDIVRDLNNQRGKGAEIFAKRRKRSEKWVIDKEQPQSPSITYAVPKTPNYYGHQEPNYNGNAKYSNISTPPSMGYDGKPFYNPFSVDLSMGNGSSPSTESGYVHYNGNYHRVHPEVKKIYLREVAVGTDADFPNQVADKPRRASMTINGSNNGGSGAYKKVSSSNGQKISSKESRRSSKCTTAQQQQILPEYEEDDEENLGEDYTPVPVKQLIQEFEKTCRPIFQYKQISPNVIPLIQHQQAPSNNNLSRFFEVQRKGDGGAHVPGRLYEAVVEDYDDDDDDGETADSRASGYDSFDEVDISQDDSDSDEDSYEGYQFDNIAKSRDGSSAASFGYKTADVAAFERYFQIHNAKKEKSDKLEEENNNVDESKIFLVVNGQDEVQKNLSNTPALDSGAHSASPNGKFFDVSFEDVGKLYENNAYKGPKISNYNGLTNYNTAPRGWDQAATYYRPIKFEKPQEAVYSDF